MDKFERLNRQTWQYNNIGNHHHHTNTGIKHPTNFEKLNAQTYYENNYKCNFYK